MKYQVVLVSLCTLVYGSQAQILSAGEQCFNTFWCDETLCCRTANGTLLNDEDFETTGGENGTCVDTPSVLGEPCNDQCGCGAGLQCHYSLSDMTFYNPTCWTEAAHQADIFNEPVW